MKITARREAVYDITLAREPGDDWPAYFSGLGGGWDIREMTITVTVSEDGTAFAEGPDISRAQAIEDDGTLDAFHGVIGVHAGYSGPLTEPLREAALQAALDIEKTRGDHHG